MTIHIKLVEECRYPTYEKKKKKKTELCLTLQPYGL